MWYPWWVKMEFKFPIKNNFKTMAQWLMHKFLKLSQWLKPGLGRFPPSLLFPFSSFLHFSSPHLLFLPYFIPSFFNSLLFHIFPFKFCMLRCLKTNLIIDRLNREHLDMHTEFLCYILNMDLNRLLFVDYDSE